MQRLRSVADSDRAPVDQRIQRIQSEREHRPPGDSREAAHALTEGRAEFGEEFSVGELRAARRFFGVAAPDERVVSLAGAAAWQQRDRPFGCEAFPRNARLWRRYAHRPDNSR